MKVEIRFIDTPISEAVVEFVKCHALSAFNRRASSIRQVVVHLESVDGTDRGPMKRCRIGVSGDFGQRLASADGESWFEVTARAFDAAERGVVRAVVQRREVLQLTREIWKATHRRQMV